MEKSDWQVVAGSCWQVKVDIKRMLQQKFLCDFFGHWKYGAIIFLVKAAPSDMNWFHL